LAASAPKLAHSGRPGVVFDHHRNLEGRFQALFERKTAPGEKVRVHRDAGDSVDDARQRQAASEAVVGADSVGEDAEGPADAGERRLLIGRGEGDAAALLDCAVEIRQAPQDGAWLELQTGHRVAFGDECEHLRPPPALGGAAPGGANQAVVYEAAYDAGYSGPAESKPLRHFVAGDGSALANAVEDERRVQLGDETAVAGAK